MGIKALRSCQLGPENTAGAAIAAITVWNGPAPMLEDQRERVRPEADTGNLGGNNRTYVPKLAAGCTMEGEATFEQLLHIFQAGIKKVSAPSDDGAGSGKVWEFPFGTTAQNTVQTYTIEAGDDQQFERMEYSFVKSFTLSGKSGEAVMLSADWVGRQISTCTKTMNKTAPVVEEILFGNSTLAIDDVGGPIGGTPVTATLKGFEFGGSTGMIENFTGDEVFFTNIKNVKPELTLKITFEHNASAVAEKAAADVETPRAIRLMFEGSALTSAYTYSKKTLIIDMAGKWLSFEKIDEEDGNDVVTGEFSVAYDATADLFCEITLVNKIAALANA